MVRNSEFSLVKEERNKLSFFKIFQGADSSSECMRAIPYNFMSNVSPKDFSYKMVIKARRGGSWEVEISKNTRFHYMEKQGWSHFVIDNGLGENEFVTFTHDGKMRFTVNIYEQSGKEMVLPPKIPSMTPLPLSSGIKKEHGVSGVTDAKKEEQTGESMGGVVRKKKHERTKPNKKEASKKVLNSVETGESSRGKKKADQEPERNKKTKKVKSKKGMDYVPEFKIVIRNSYLKFLAIPKGFVKDYLPSESMSFTFHHANGKKFWKVLCLVRKTRTVFSSGWTKLAREYPLLVGDRCSFKLIKPREFLIEITKKAKEEITMIIDE
ncbi:unnamed protein product [Cochlearia groenlandica]